MLRMAEIRSRAQSLKEEGDRHYEDLLKALNTNGKVAIFGAGEAGSLVADVLKSRGITISCFSDNAERLWDTQKDGVPIVTPEALRNWEGTVIIASWAEEQIAEQLKALGVSAIDTEIYVSTLVQPQRQEYFDHLEDIERVEGMLADEKSKDVLCSLALHALTLDRSLLYTIHDRNQYFSDPEFVVRPGDVIVDGGAFTGDTVHDIVQRFGPVFEQIHCFEPNDRNITALKDQIAQDHLEGKVTIHAQGLFSRSGIIDYAGAGSSFHVATPGEEVVERIPMVKLDECLPDARINLIKMDIEGGEIEALKGAEQTIKRCTPRLSICVYHFPDHLWNIAFMLHDFVPGYRFMLRNHTDQRRETVLYALPA